MRDERRAFGDDEENTMFASSARRSATRVGSKHAAPSARGWLMAAGAIAVLGGCFGTSDHAEGASVDASPGSGASASASAGPARGDAGTNGASANGAELDGASASGAELDGATGSDGAAGSDAGPDAASGSFALSWEDDFNTLDLTAWQLQTFTFAGNEAQFSTQNATVANGVLTISLTANPGNSAEPYLGVEMRSNKTLTYGKVSASMRFAHGSGVVSGLVLFYTPYPNCDWNEIDIEHLGDSSKTSQLNCQVFRGVANPQCTASVSPTPDPLVVNLGVDAETAFHQYDIEWTPTAVKTSIDGRPLRTWSKYISRMSLPQTVLLTIWASASASWAGALQADSAPTTADVDWIKVYDWQP